MRRPLPTLLLLSLAAGSLFAQADSPRITLPMTDDGLPGTGPIRRYDWFQRLWTERRTEWRANQQRDQGALVFLGDSITQGWGELPWLIPGVKLANRGISGDTTRGVLVRLQEDVLSLNPRGVVLLIGTNDLEDNSAPEVVAGNLKLILDALQAHNPSMPVVLLQVLPSSATMRRPVDRIKKLNTIYRDLALNYAQVHVLDTWTLFADSLGNAQLEDMPDLLHPNAVGYAKMAKALRPQLEALGLAPSWPDEFKPEHGFTPLFNGRDLSGWRAPDGTALDGREATPDNRFLARNGRITVAAAHRERRDVALTTTASFPQDFTLRLEFRATPNADSGIYVRGIQVQCRDFPGAGPFSALSKFKSCDWNEIEITVKGRLARATCNGEVLVEAMEIPADGPLGFESDRGLVEYRRIRLQTH